MLLNNRKQNSQNFVLIFQYTIQLLKCVSSDLLLAKVIKHLMQNMQDYYKKIKT